MDVFSVSFMEFPSGRTLAIPRSEIEATFGERYREVRRRLVYDEDDLEAVLENCHDPQGEVASLLYQDRGLEVWLNDSGAATGLRFAITLLSEGVEPCEASVRGSNDE